MQITDALPLGKAPRPLLMAPRRLRSAPDSGHAAAPRSASLQDASSFAVACAIGLHMDKNIPRTLVAAMQRMALVESTTGRRGSRRCEGLVGVRLPASMSIRAGVCSKWRLRGTCALGGSEHIGARDVQQVRIARGPQPQRPSCTSPIFLSEFGCGRSHFSASRRQQAARAGDFVALAQVTMAAMQKEG